jgi:hypothetical protein
MIERISLSEGGRAVSVDATTKTVVTDFGNYTGQVVNVIPPQKAGRIAEIAGAADHTGWCPIDPVSFASKLLPNVHVIGDSCIAGTIPKSASAAHAEAKACAAAIVALIADKSPDVPQLQGTCFNTVAPAYAFSLSGTYQAKDGQFAEIGGNVTSPVDAPQQLRQREAEQAETWFRTITADVFG